MKSIAETQPTDTVDLLKGWPDYSGGRATAYFGSLSEEDCEIVQWYAENNIAPLVSEEYVSEFVRGYAVTDPKRLDKDGMDESLAEVGRLRRYLELVTSSGNFFPFLRSDTEIVTDDNGAIVGTIQNVGWGELGFSRGIFSLSYQQEYVKERVLPLVEYAAQFIINPASNPKFDQELIFDHYREQLRAEEALLQEPFHP